MIKFYTKTVFFYALIYSQANYSSKIPEGCWSHNPYGHTLINTTLLIDDNHPSDNPLVQCHQPPLTRYDRLVAHPSIQPHQTCLIDDIFGALTQLRIWKTQHKSHIELRPLRHQIINFLNNLPPKLYSTTYNKNGQTILHCCSYDSFLHQIFYYWQIENLHPKTIHPDSSPGRTPLTILLTLQISRYGNYSNQRLSFYIDCKFTQLIRHLLKNTDINMFFQENKQIAQDLSKMGISELLGLIKRGQVWTLD